MNIMFDRCFALQTRALTGARLKPLTFDPAKFDRRLEKLIRSQPRTQLGQSFGSFDAWETEFRRIAKGLGGGRNAASACQADGSGGISWQVRQSTARLSMSSRMRQSPRGWRLNTIR